MCGTKRPFKVFGRGRWRSCKLALSLCSQCFHSLRSLDSLRECIARVQLALEPPELLIRIPRDACQFYEFWRASELIDIGRREAEKALDAAGY